VTTAAGAVACGICCVLPFAFPAVAAASTGSVLAWLAGAHKLGNGTGGRNCRRRVDFDWNQSRRARRSPSRATVYMMALATAVLLLAVLWPRLEPHLIRAVTQR
jgi:hypothetical protein